MKIWKSCVDSHRDYKNVYCSLDLLQWQGSSSSLWEKVTAYWRPVSETPSPGRCTEHIWDLSRDPQGAQSRHWQHLRKAGGRPRQVEGLRQQVVLGLFPEKEVVLPNSVNSDIFAKQAMMYVSSHTRKIIRWYNCVHALIQKCLI